MRRPISWFLLCVTGCTSPAPGFSQASSESPASAAAGAGSGLGGSGPGLGAPQGGAGAPGPNLPDLDGPDPDVPVSFAPPVGKTALLIGQSGRRAHVDYVLGTRSIPAGGSVYAELYTGNFLSFEQAAFVDYLARSYPGSFVEVGLSWKDNRVNAGYCDLADPACVARGGAIEPELALVAGKYDAPLAALGQTLKAYAGLKFLVRVDYEVSPGMHCAPNDEDACPAYGQAFRHIRQLWAGAGIGNVQFVFHPTRGWAKQMYPGADVTDWIAFSVFNHDLCLPTPEGSNGGCQPGAHLDQNLARDLAWAEQQDKPILIAETTVQNPSDATAAGFNEYLSRLFELVEQHPQVRGLTYINMKWAGGWIYGEDWTEGAFGDVDARLAHFPETRERFCRQLDAGRFVDAAFASLGCDSVPTSAVVVPPQLDAPVSERLLVLGNNRCARTPAGSEHEGTPIAQSSCDDLALTGQGRFHLVEQAGRARLWSDVSWLCWSAEGDAVVQRVCSDAEAQRFAVMSLAAADGYRDVRLVALDGRCVGAPAEAAVDAPLTLAPCSGSPLQTFRL